MLSRFFNYLGKFFLVFVLAISITYTNKTFAAAFTVDSTFDLVDATPGDGKCATKGTRTKPSVCTLRAAIMETNALAGTDTISVPSGTYKLTIASSGTANDDTTGSLDITDSVTITGDSGGGTVINGDSIDRVFSISGGSSSMSYLKIRGGRSTNYSGGINNSGTLSISYSTISDNQASDDYVLGGGIYNSGTLSIISSTISDNQASGGSYGAGGGIFNDGTVNIVNSTISNNQASASDSFGMALGGGIYNDTTLSIASSTISDNQVSDGSNSASNEGGGIYNHNNSTVELKNSILSNNTSPNCQDDTAGFVSGGYNIVSDSGCFTAARGDQMSTDPLLGSLADNGGPTKTMALQVGSPAIDAGNPRGCTGNGTGGKFSIALPLTTDQRGYTRPVDGDSDGTARCDVGAFEKQVVSLPLQTLPSH